MARYSGFRYGERRYAAEEVLGTASDVLDSPPWESHEFGEDTEVTVQGRDNAGNPVARRIILSTKRRPTWTIEVRNEDGHYIAILEEWWDAFYESEADVGAELRFKIAYDNPLRESVAYPNHIWIRDVVGHVREIFHLTRSEPKQSGDVRTVDVTAMSRINQLGREPIIDYDTSVFEGGTATIGEILTSWFGGQMQRTPLKLGDIEPLISERSISISVQQVNVLEAIRQIQSQLPLSQAGYFYVDSKGFFHWKVRTGWQRGQVLAIGGNMTGIQRDENWDDTYNRLFLYGEGDDPRTRLTLKDGGHPTEYYDGATIGEYGVLPFIKQDRRIKYGDTLLAMAARLVEEHQHPQYTYNVNVLELTIADTSGIGTWAELDLGSDVRVVAEQLDIDIQLKVRKIVRDLGHPLRMRVELNNRTRRLSDLFEELYRQVDAPLDVRSDPWRYPDIARVFTVEEIEEAEDTGGIDFRDGDWSYVPAVGEIPSMMSYWDEALGAWVPLANENWLRNELDVLEAEIIDAYTQAIAQAIDDALDEFDPVPEFGDDIQPVGVANDEGTSETLPRSDHVHKIEQSTIANVLFHTATTKANLPTFYQAPAPAIAYTTQTGRYYVRQGSDWLCISNVESS